MKLLTLTIISFLGFSQVVYVKNPVTYISTAIYITSKMTENKKGYILGKETPNSKGKYIFTFYPDNIVLKSESTTRFDIIKVDNKRAPYYIEYIVKNIIGEKFKIGISPNENDSTIDWYGDYRNGIFNKFTMIRCKRLTK